MNYFLFLSCNSMMSDLFHQCGSMFVCLSSTNDLYGWLPALLCRVHAFENFGQSQLINDVIINYLVIMREMNPIAHLPLKCITRLGDAEHF
jgi:hypothetical protein